LSDAIDDFLADDPKGPAQEKSKLNPGEIELHNKIYRTVWLRVDMFRADHPHWSIETDVLQDDGDFIRMQCKIKNEEQRVLATGIASEFRKTSRLHQSSHVEVCETSAVGRALAFLGYGGEDLQIASAEELVSALGEQKEFDANKYLIRHNEAWRDNHDSVQYIKEAIRNEDMFAAVEGYAELGHDVQTALHVAPTKGGCWTIAEKKYLRSEEFNKTMKEYVRDAAK